jgi:hypothetical protein
MSNRARHLRLRFAHAESKTWGYPITEVFGGASFDLIPNVEISPRAVPPRSSFLSIVLPANPHMAMIIEGVEDLVNDVKR